MIVHKFLILLMMVSFAGCLKIVTFGDSTLVNNGCNSELLGVPFPPAPPYSEFNRYSSKWGWVDYLCWELPDVEIICCACGTALVAQDFSWDPLDTGNPILVPGLLTQIKKCNRDKNLKKLGMDEEEQLVAIIQIGANDFIESVASQTVPSIQKFQEALRFGIQNLTQIGFDRIYIGDTNVQHEYPLITALEKILSKNAVKQMLQIRQGLFDAFDEEVKNLMKESNIPISKIPIGEFFVDIQQEAQVQGLEAFQPCIKPLSPWWNREVLPNCTEFNKRVFFDDAHLADWAQQQYSKRMLDFLNVSE